MLIQQLACRARRDCQTFQLLNLKVGIYLQTKASNNDGLDLVFTSRIIGKRIQILTQTKLARLGIQAKVTIIIDLIGFGVCYSSK